MYENKERAEFESHVRANVYSTANEKVVGRRPNGEYTAAHIEMMWRGWWARAVKSIDADAALSKKGGE